MKIYTDAPTLGGIMRTLFAILALAAVCGCRSVSGPEVSRAPMMRVQATPEKHPQLPPGAPGLEHLRAYVQGDSTIIEGRFSETQAAWSLAGAFHAGDLHQEVGWGYFDWNFAQPTRIWESYDGVYIGWLTYWRDDHRFRLAASLDDHRYSLTGELTLYLSSTAGSAVYVVTVKGPSGHDGRLALN